MIRSNVGNIVTNGQQVLSVGAFTAGGLKRSLGRADTALNNLSDEQKKEYYKMRANKMMDEVNEYNSKGASFKQHLTLEELESLRKMEADNVIKKINGDKGSDGESVDDVLKDVPSSDNKSPLTLEENSEQVKQLNIAIAERNKWKNKYDTLNKETKMFLKEATRDNADV